ncbi:MAG: hypothetical protein IBV52_03595 [Candidatus Bathyarchaeota archaeon]
MKMNDEFEDLGLDWEEPQPPPERKPARRWTVLGMLGFLLLAAACSYLAVVYQENRAAMQRLQAGVERAMRDHRQLQDASTEVRGALIQLADHAVSETTLHHRLGHRKQALADLDRAQKLLALAENLKTCNCPSETESIQAVAVQDKLDKLIADIQPIQQELSQPAPAEEASSEQADSASAEAKLDQAQPEQPNKSGEQYSGGEPDA